MTEKTFAPQSLANRAVIRITGDGALTFLQTLLTCDVQALRPGQAAYGALLSPQGKILHDVFVMATSDGALLDCAADQRTNLLAKLAMYRLRSKLTITISDDTEVAVAAETMPDSFTDPRLAAMGFRAFRPKGMTPPGDGYDARRIACGLADSVDIGTNALFPHEANFDQFNGVSFIKGCFVGQEVVSRMQHRGTARSRILPVMCDGVVPAPGTPIAAGDAVIGEILSSADSHALALIRLDRLTEASAPLLSAGVRVHVQKPSWITYDVIIPELAS